MGMYMMLRCQHHSTKSALANLYLYQLLQVRLSGCDVLKSLGAFPYGVATLRVDNTNAIQIASTLVFHEQWWKDGVRGGAITPQFFFPFCKRGEILGNEYGS